MVVILTPIVLYNGGWNPREIVVYMPLSHWNPGSQCEMPIFFQSFTGFLPKFSLGDLSTSPISTVNTTFYYCMSLLYFILIIA